jgi:pyruvate ferredoxin oxidoreductase delta subunit
MYCPDAAINEDLEVDLDFCKGCGICAEECPKKAITMVREER